MLIAARTDTERFHKYIWDKDKSTWKDRIWGEFLEGRIKFLSAEGNEVDPAFFPSMVVIFYRAAPTSGASEDKKIHSQPMTWSERQMPK